MENLTRSINLSEIVYPVFKVGTERPLNETGLLVFIRIYKDGPTVYKILDDTSINKPTLAMRRLELLKLGEPLKKIGSACFFLGDLVKIAKPNIWFIDSIGQLFQYKKVNNSKLVFRKIKNIIPISTGGSIIEVEGIHSRFKCLFNPNENVRYAGILELSMAHILYGLYDEQPKDTRRKV